MALDHYLNSSPSRRSVRMGSQTQLHLQGDMQNHNNVKDEAKGKTWMAGSANNSSKLGTFAGVFVPTSLNVLSILIKFFLRKIYS